MEIIEASPKASTHIKTLQKIGYSFNSAISDIIDNSITAEAKIIKINFDFDSAKISILDDVHEFVQLLMQVLPGK